MREITVDSPLAPAGRGQGEGVGKASVIYRTMLTRLAADEKALVAWQKVFVQEIQADAEDEY